MLIVGSIFLVNCDTNLNSTLSDDVSDLMKTESENIEKKQINIDELLIPKETFEIVDLLPLKKVAVILEFLIMIFHLLQITKLLNLQIWLSIL